MKTFRLTLLLMLVMFGGTAVIYSLVTDFDDSFGTNGIVTTAGNGSAKSMAVQNDGKIVVAARTGTAIINLLRYLENGTLDNTFGTMGVAQTTITNDWRDTLYIFDLYVTDVIVLSSGKLLVVGYTTQGDFDMNTPDIIAIRYLSNGNVDTTFGYNGLARIHVNGEDHAFAVAEKSDGKLIIVGDSHTQSGDSSPVVLRLLENGAVDTAFGDNGATQTAVGALGNAFNIALQDDNKIVASGTAIIGGKPKGFVIRYTENGALDTTFSGTGYAALNIGIANTLGWEVAINNEADILFSGTFSNGGDNDLFLAKLDDTGNLVTTFGTNGIATSDFGAVGSFQVHVTLDLFNRVIVTGESDSHLFVARYDAVGVLDTTFETNGFLSIPVGTSSGGIDILVQPNDQKAVILGSSSDGIVLARLDEFYSSLYLPLVVR